MTLQQLVDDTLADGYDHNTVKEFILVYLDSVGYEVNDISHMVIDRAIRRAHSKMEVA